MRFHIIPNLNELDKYLDLSKKYDFGFEYNEFFKPEILDNKKLLNEIISKYKSLNRKNDTLHGVFFDIVLDSCDSKIRDISIKRVESSLNIASELNVNKVVFHTNYINFMAKSDFYADNWVKKNKEVYLDLLSKYPNITIYIENMFDENPYLLKRLLSEANHPRLRCCLDFAHASISPTPIDVWFNELKPFINHIHINDNDKIKDMHEEIGKGILDFDLIFKLINQMDKDITVLIEINDLNKVLNSYKYIKEKYKC